MFFKGALLTKTILFIFLLILTGLVLLLVSNFVHAVIFGFILGGILYPYKEMAQEKLKVPDFFSAFLICLVFVLLLIFPLVVVFYNLSQELSTVYIDFSNYFDQGGSLNVDAYAAQATEFLQRYHIPFDQEAVAVTLKTWAQKLTGSFIDELNNLTQSTLVLFSQSLIMLIVLISVLSYGKEAKIYLLNHTPTDQRVDVLNMIARFNQVNFATLVVNSLAGLMQGLLCAFVLFLLQFETALFFGCLIALSAFVPGVGILLVCAPISLYLMYMGMTTAGVSFLVFSGVMFFIAENLIKPRYLSRQMQMNPMIVFLSVIGGMAQFGILGIFYGPLIVGLFLTAMDILLVSKDADADADAGAVG